jgi:hypothetical protein
MDSEIKAINAVSEALSAIEDPEIRKRVLRWANDRFGYIPTAKLSSPTQTVLPSASAIGEGSELPGIAKVSETGEFRLTIRDVKARSAIDAALRLTHIAIRAHEKLTGQKSMSSKSILVPLLKSWRVYDGNARFALAKHKGILRNGDALELDFHAQADADRFIAEAVDQTIEGAWKPGSRAKAKKRLALPAKDGA